MDKLTFVSSEGRNRIIFTLNPVKVRIKCFFNVIEQNFTNSLRGTVKPLLQKDRSLNPQSNECNMTNRKKSFAFWSF